MKLSPKNQRKFIMYRTYSHHDHDIDGMDEEFWPIMKQPTGEGGSVMLMTGLLWHGAGDNRTNKPRVGILGQYLPKFVKPMEDQLASIDMKIIKKCNKKLQNLLGVGYPYPQVLDTTKSAN